MTYLLIGADEARERFTVFTSANPVCTRSPHGVDLRATWRLQCAAPEVRDNAYRALQTLLRSFHNPRPSDQGYLWYAMIGWATVWRLATDHVLSFTTSGSYWEYCMNQPPPVDLLGPPVPEVTMPKSRFEIISDLV
jgi:hypothetical protein